MKENCKLGSAFQMRSWNEPHGLSADEWLGALGSLLTSSQHFWIFSLWPGLTLPLQYPAYHERMPSLMGWLQGHWEGEVSSGGESCWI